MYVYKITNITNNKVYIGQTVRPPKKRIQSHISDAIREKLNTPLHRVIRKYGAQNFTWEVIDTANSREELTQKEKYWISYYDSCASHHGYNISPGGWACGGNTYANIEDLSDTRKRLSASKMGGKNPNSKKVLVTDIQSGDELLFASMQEAADWLNLSSHVPVSRRCRGVAPNPLMNRYWIKYYNGEGVTTTESANKMQQVG